MPRVLYATSDVFDEPVVSVNIRKDEITEVTEPEKQKIPMLFRGSPDVKESETTRALFDHIESMSRYHGMVKPTFSDCWMVGSRDSLEVIETYSMPDGDVCIGITEDGELEYNLIPKEYTYGRKVTEALNSAVNAVRDEYRKNGGIMDGRSVVLSSRNHLCMSVPEDNQINWSMNDLCESVHRYVLGLGIFDILLSDDRIEDMPAAKFTIQLGYIAQNLMSVTGMSQDVIMSYLYKLNAAEVDAIFDKLISASATEMFAEYGGMSSDSDSTKKVAVAFDAYLETCSDEDLVYFYDNNMPDKVSDVSYTDLLKELGVCSLDNPSYIYIYPKDFELKENVTKLIEDYNSGVENEDDKIEYTDLMAMIMSSVSSIINAISVVLICFVSISLIVSSIMIGIITYISVLERTKEIGILRAVGASKGDISSVFNAETMIVGLLAGLVGVVSTVILCFPINMIARSVTGIESLTAVLPWYGYLLIVLSVILTLIAGIFPAMMAAKKDPVIALRTE